MPLQQPPIEDESIPERSAKGAFVLLRQNRFNRFQDLRSGFKAENIIASFIYAYQGLVYVAKTQRNFRIHLFIAAVAVGVASNLHLAPVEWAMLAGLIGLVLFAEILNTSIELFVDMLTAGHFDLRAKAIKDLAAGGVLIMALSAAICGVCIFTPHILQELHINPFW